VRRTTEGRHCRAHSVEQMQIPQRAFRRRAALKRREATRRSQLMAYDAKTNPTMAATASTSFATILGPNSIIPFVAELAPPVTFTQHQSHFVFCLLRFPVRVHLRPARSGHSNRQSLLCEWRSSAAKGSGSRTRAMRHRTHARRRHGGVGEVLHPAVRDTRSAIASGFSGRLSSGTEQESAVISSRWRAGGR